MKCILPIPPPPPLPQIPLPYPLPLLTSLLSLTLLYQSVCTRGTVESWTFRSAESHKVYQGGCCLTSGCLIRYVLNWVYSLQVPKPFNSLSVDMFYWWQTFNLSDLLTSDILAWLILLVSLCKHPISQMVILNPGLLVIVNVWLWYISVMSVCPCDSENGVN